MAAQRVAIAGLGNCAASALQGFVLHRQGRLSTTEIGLPPEAPADALHNVEFVAAFDIDRRKVGQSVPTALFAAPNRVPDYGADLSQLTFPIFRGPTLDGIAPTMADRPPDEVFWPDESIPAVDVAEALRRTGATLLLCMLPTGATQAADHYAAAALSAGIGLVNGSATLTANRPELQAAFRTGNLLLIGDDFKSQFGATYLNQVLLEALQAHSCRIVRTTQSNVGGNTDFLNMLDRGRGAVKERSKLAALANWVGDGSGSAATASISGYRPELGDTKIAEIEIEAAGFARRPFRLRVELVVEDSPNAAGVIMNILAAAAAAGPHDLTETGGRISGQAMKNPWAGGGVTPDVRTSAGR